MQMVFVYKPTLAIFLFPDRLLFSLDQNKKGT